MKVLAFSPAAEADIDGIWDYSADNWGPEQADRYLAAVQKHTQAMLAADAIGLYAGLDARRYFHCA